MRSTRSRVVLRLSTAASLCALTLLTESCGDLAGIDPPAAATGLTAVAASNTEIALSWSPTSGAASYRVYRAATLLPAIVTGTSYTDTGLTPLTPYTYAVSACAGVDGTKCGAQSTAATASTKPTMLVFSVTKAGTGAGTVTSSPTGISCGAICSASFASATSVTLTATGSAGSTFIGWSAGACSGAGTCTTSVTAAQSVLATFILTPSSGLIGLWQSPSLQVPSLQIVFAAENAASGSGTLGVPPTSPVAGPSDPKYTGDNFIITSGSNNGSTVTFSGSLGNNGTCAGCIGLISFSGTLNGGTLTGNVNYTPPNTVTQTFAAQTVTGLVLTKGP